MENLSVKEKNKLVRSIQDKFNSDQNKSENLRSIEFKINISRIMLMSSLSPEKLEMFKKISNYQKKLNEIRQRELIEFVLDKIKNT